MTKESEENRLKKTSSLLQLVILIESNPTYLIIMTLIMYVHIYPYRHSQEMIKKLENTGLGYYVHSANTMQILGISARSVAMATSIFLFHSGSVPLRHLVYRVLDLPSSMQSLVYDFGQLNSDTEESYAKKIIENYVCND